MRLGLFLKFFDEAEFSKIFQENQAMFFKKSRTSVRGLTVLLVCLIASSLLAGCAGSKYGKQTVTPNYYRACYEPISQIRSDADAANRNTAAGAMVGAILGGVIGYQKKGAKGAAVGAVAGAVVGGAASYLITDSIQKKNRAERFAAYSQAIDQDIQGMEHAVAAARMTAKCYENAYAALEKSYKAKQISRDEMVARLTEIRDGTNDANTILAAYRAGIAENQAVYRDIQRAEAKQGSKSLSKSQLQTIGGKEQKLSRADSEAQKELEALRQLNQRCGSQLKTITARKAPDGYTPLLAGAAPLPVCPSAGAE